MQLFAVAIRKHSSFLMMAKPHGRSRRADSGMLEISYIWALLFAKDSSFSMAAVPKGKAQRADSEMPQIYDLYSFMWYVHYWGLHSTWPIEILTYVNLYLTLCNQHIAENLFKEQNAAFSSQIHSVTLTKTWFRKNDLSLMPNLIGLFLLWDGSFHPSIGKIMKNLYKKT